MSRNIWLIGPGLMGEEYAKVLLFKKENFVVIGNSHEKAKKFNEKYGVEVKTGGVEKFLDQKPEICTHAIVAVCEDKTLDVMKSLLNFGVKNIFVEKPAGSNYREIKELYEFSTKFDAKIFVAYNRRFYSSTLKAQEIIKNDGGVQSMLIQFTEWAHVIRKLDKRENIKNEWFWSNSTHVLDLAFCLGGAPIELSSYIAGGLDWHPHCSVFAGAGKTDKGALFSYHADWTGPGRWGLEVITSKHRLIMCPLEKLKIQNIGEIAISDVEIDDQVDKDFKPGFLKQVEAFLDHKMDQNLIDLRTHYLRAGYYNQIYQK